MRRNSLDNLWGSFFFGGLAYIPRPQRKALCVLSLGVHEVGNSFPQPVLSSGSSIPAA